MEQAEEINTLAKQQFAFLKTEMGFTKPLLNRPKHALLIYRNATMGIRIEMNRAMNDMEILLGKLGDNGKFPFANEGRERILWLLESLLTRQLQVQDKRILALDRIRLDTRRMEKAAWDYTWDTQQWTQVLRLYQTLLRDHIDLILQQPLEVLFPSTIDYLAMGNTRQEWEQLAKDHFAFLGEYGFRHHPVCAVNNWLDIVTWLGADRGIQLTVDHREKDLSCDLISLIDGKIPATDKNVLTQHEDFMLGRGVAIPLCDLLSQQLGITDSEIESIGNLRRLLNIRHYSDYDYRYISTFIMQSASLARRYLKVLMDTPLETIFASARTNYHFVRF